MRWLLIEALRDGCPRAFLSLTGVLKSFCTFCFFYPLVIFMLAFFFFLNSIVGHPFFFYYVFNACHLLPKDGKRKKLKAVAGCKAVAFWKVELDAWLPIKNQGGEESCEYLLKERNEPWHYLFYFSMKINNEQELLKAFDLLTPNSFEPYVSIFVKLFIFSAWISGIVNCSFLIGHLYCVKSKPAFYQ